MNKNVKSLLIVLPISLLLSGLVIFLCFIDASFNMDRIIITVIISVWAFFLIPSILYALNWVKIRFMPDPAQSFRIGWIWGDLIFLVLVIGAPVTGILWFINTIKSISLQKRFNKNSETKTDELFNM